MTKKKDMTKDEKGCAITCQRCGHCCTVFEGEATIQDIATWIAARRYDILDWVDPVMGVLSKVMAFDVWINPETHDDATCPWLKKEKGEKKFSCAIHDIKPEVCRDFPGSIAHGKELGCPACQEESSDKAGQGIEPVDPGRDDD